MCTQASWAERQELHEERRALELRVREEAGRARQAAEAAERAKSAGGGGSLLERLFNQAANSPPFGGGGGRGAAAKEYKEAWAESTAPLLLEDSARMPRAARSRSPPAAAERARPQARPLGQAEREQASLEASPSPPAAP